MKTHALTIPRIGYVHSWSRTQDEGWVRAALDHYSVPYTYFADQKLQGRQPALEVRRDRLPARGRHVASMISGIAMTGTAPIPYKKTEQTPNLGGVDETDDIRGGMGFEGLQELAKFVQQGGTLITEGSTSTLMAEYNLAGGVTVEHPAELFARGSILRGVFSDLKSPIAYGYDGKDLPVYFNQDPVLNAAARRRLRRLRRRWRTRRRRSHQRRRGPERHAECRAHPHLAARTRRSVIAVARGARCRRWTRRTGRARRTWSGAPMRALARRGGRGAFAADAGPRPRVVLQFPANANDMLLSGTLGGGEAIANRALVVDMPLGDGHVVMFALRPFWRWQTQGTYFLAFNAILNWDHLDAGKPAAAPPSATAGQ